MESEKQITGTNQENKHASEEAIKVNGDKKKKDAQTKLNR